MRLIKLRLLVSIYHLSKIYEGKNGSSNITGDMSTDANIDQQNAENASKRGCVKSQILAQPIIN